ncbi:MAG TPA: alpha-ketoacid dehydrogenase subunit beta [Chloroflexota bacterium]
MSPVREITFAEATVEAMREEMRRDPTVFAMGEDIARQGGIFGQWKGLPQEFGVERVIDTPISEAAIAGAAVGAAMTGMRPVVDMHFADFVTCAMDEIVNQAAKARYMFGGQVKVPVVFRCPDGIINSAGGHHCQSLEAWFVHVPGLKVVVPSTPADAKGLLKAAIRDDDPVIYCEHKAFFKKSGPVPDDEDFVVPLGKASVRRVGSDVTVLAYSIMVDRALEAAATLAREGVDAEVVDLRSLVPLDKETVFASVAKTGRVVIAHEATARGGFGAELAALLVDEMFDYLDAPVKRVAARNVPVPFSPPLEHHVKPKTEDVVRAVLEIVPRPAAVRR